MHRASNPANPAKILKGAAKNKRAAPRSNAKKRTLDAVPPQSPVQISIFDFAVSIGVRLFPEPNERLAPKPRRPRKEPVS